MTSTENIGYTKTRATVKNTTKFDTDTTTIGARRYLNKTYDAMTGMIHSLKITDDNFIITQYNWRSNKPKDKNDNFAEKCDNKCDNFWVLDDINSIGNHYIASFESTNTTINSNYFYGITQSKGRLEIFQKSELSNT